VIPEIEERDKPVLPVEWYAKLLAGLPSARDRAIFLIACFCALRPSELFGLIWGCYRENVFMIANTAWNGRLQRKKIKRKNRFGGTNYRLVAIPEAVRWAIAQWRTVSPNAHPDALMFPGMRARGQLAIGTPAHPDTWLRLRLIRLRRNWASRFTPPFRCSAVASPPMAPKRRIRRKCRRNSGTATRA
jgi:integrase